MIHAKATKPRIFPWNNDRTPEQINRAQDMGGDLTLTQTKLYEIGRDGKMGVHKTTPSFAYSMTQYEYSMDFWRSLANLEDPASAGLNERVTLSDMETTKFDIAAYLTDDNDDFQGTIIFPKLRVNGFSINIGDPDAIVENKFDLIGEEYKILTDKYLAFQKATVSVPGIETIVLSPAAIEFASGDYVFKVLRVRDGVVSELLEDSTSTYDVNSWRFSTGNVIVQSCLLGDIVKVFYPSSTAYTTLWADNDIESTGVFADQCTILLKVGVGANQQIYRLQSVAVDAKLDRTDYKEVGNSAVVQTGVKARTVTVKLGRIMEDFSLEEILRGTSAYPYIDARDFSSDISLTVKIYTDNTKTTFKMGYKITELSPTALANGAKIEDYDTGDVTLESDNFMVTPDESEL